jgi:type IV pilus biogenesis protein PilP
MTRRQEPARSVRETEVRKAQTKATKPARASTTVASAKATQRVGLSRRDVSLIGVFGGEGERRALLRLPNGKIQRVSAGDRVQGVQVAAVGADSVQLRGRGRDTVLRLPD